MADYYDLYNAKKKEVKKYEDYISTLTGFRDKLAETKGWSGFADEIKKINGDLDALEEDLKAAVRYSSVFSGRAEAVSDKKEKLPLSDSLLSAAYNELQDEISRLNRKKNAAAVKRDEYKEKWQQSRTLWPF